MKFKFKDVLFICVLAFFASLILDIGLIIVVPEVSNEIIMLNTMVCYFGVMILSSIWMDEQK